MVSSKIETKLRTAYESLATISIDLSLLDGHILEVAFEVITADTFVAGIADKILSGDSISIPEKVILNTPLIFDKNFWVTRNGQMVDIEHHKLLCNLAKRVENLRKLCVKSIL